MKFILEPKGWPSSIDAAPNGLLARVRKGKMLLYFKRTPFDDNKIFVFDMSGRETKVTGTVQAVELRTEK